MLSVPAVQHAVQGCMYVLAHAFQRLKGEFYHVEKTVREQSAVNKKRERKW